MPITKIVMMIAAIVLSACISAPVELSKTAEDDYKKALQYMENENYPNAVLFLEKFSAKYPYSQYATNAELLRLKAAYLDGQYVLSETLGLRFIDAHPDHKDRVYAQFTVAMSYYKQSSSAELDQQFSHKSRDAFLELNQQFPNNAYVADIEKYLNILTNRVAEHELIVGKFYFEKKLYVAALNRLLLIKNQYANANIIDESLYYLVASYAALEQQDLAKETKAILKREHPQSPWLVKAKNL